LAELLSFWKVQGYSGTAVKQTRVVPVHAPKGVSATFTITQLEKQWKHAPDFGITTTKRNPTTLA